MQTRKDREGGKVGRGEERREATFKCDWTFELKGRDRPFLYSHLRSSFSTTLHNMQYPKVGYSRKDAQD